MLSNAAMVEAALARARAGRCRFVADLKRFAVFPTVGAQPGCAGAMRHAAAWLARHLTSIGLDHARVEPTGGHPVVYADWLHAPGRPTVLMYGHYDVQPPDPLAEWTSPPFAPTQRGENLYARGITDDKGQVMAHVAALASFLGAGGRLPVNVRVVVEGEEETGSQHFGDFLDRHAARLASDVAVVSDTPMLGPDRPAITYALRGGLSAEVEVDGQRFDLHSGLYGGAVHNPLQALCETIASLHDAEGRVAIPGFYDGVRDWDPAERAYMARTGASDGDILRAAGARSAWGEPGYSVYERTTVRPSLSINGVVGGYQGPGSKAVIPARAAAKLNVRLVPGQDPRAVQQRLLEHFRRVTPPGLRSTVRDVVSVEPVLIDRRLPVLRAAATAYHRGFGAAPVFVRNGGTIAAVAELTRRLKLPTVLMGFALPDDRLHAPNEKLHRPTFFRAIDSAIWLQSEIARVT